ncbi:MAG: LysR family transcriptional regulator ArgP [Pseudomonadota bacterium]
MTDMLDYKLIEALAEVVRLGGFEKASRVLNITQSAISQRVRLLEEMTGQVLLVRSTPPVATAAGTRLLRHFLQVRHLEEDLLQDMDPESGQRFESVALGVNADSIATWFLDVVTPFLETERVTLDVRVEDQDQTHSLLRSGHVLGCISSRETPVQGCSIAPLGTMVYRMVAKPDFVARWFPSGVTPEAVANAPLLVFNRKDLLQHTALEQIPGVRPENAPTHYLPSSEKFVDFIRAGLAYGMLPDLQIRDLLSRGLLMDLMPDHPVPVRLYWHCWNLKSAFIRRFSDCLVRGARRSLV